MSWHCLPELAAESSEGSSQVSAPFVPWKKSRTAERCSSDGNSTACYPCSRSGTTSEPSMGDPGVGLWMSRLRVSRVSRSLSPGSEEVTTTSAICGQRPSVSFARWDRDSSSWKTFPDLFPVAISEQSSETWPKRGMTRNGIAFRLSRSGRRTSGIVSGSSPHKAEFPTPSATEYGSSGNGEGNNVESRGRPSLQTMAAKKLWPTPRAFDSHSITKRTPGLPGTTGGGCANLSERVAEAEVFYPTPSARDWKSSHASAETLEKNSRPLNEVVAGGSGAKLNPVFVEYLMGWPMNWSSVEKLESGPSVTVRFREWLSKHGSA